MSKIKELLSQAFSQLDEYNKGGASKHNLLWKAKLIGAIEYSFITDVDDNTNYSGAIKEYTFADGTPFGIKEEE